MAAHNEARMRDIYGGEDQGQRDEWHVTAGRGEQEYPPALVGSGKYIEVAQRVIAKGGMQAKQQP